MTTPTTIRPPAGVRPLRWAVTLFAGLAAPASAAPPVDFNRDIRPILSNNCYQCHGPDEDERKAELRLDTFAGATADLGGTAAVVPGKPGESTLVQRISAKEAGERMPPKKTGKALTPKEIELLTQWVKDGAKYARHWSHVKPVRPTSPAVRDKSWPRTPVDAFILARLEAEGLKPSPEADRYALARRVSLDLTGLPPTPEDVATFAADARPDAYERFVDRLLESDRYGEHMARTWLDLARYADSAGYADDPPRTIWKYRDYVIRAFNANTPFDRFTIEQIAGDLLPDPTEDQLVATAFHRNTLTNNEGGTSDEEFRNVAVVDRVNTTLTVWMGTSAACAQCHNHKYDPLSQKEYFELFAFFNNTADADRTDESPVLNVGDPPDRKAKRAAAEKRLAGIDKAARFQPPLVQAALKVQGEGLKKTIARLKPDTTVPIMRELTGDQRRKTRIQYRGNFQELGDEVREGVPAAFHPLPKDAPRNRLSLAKWLVSEDNPLTARVVANRYWEQIFGTGLVRTSEEFGIQGDLPSHPELLDWLATELVRLKWDTKAFLKLLVTSAAYRQSSKVTPAMLEKDPDNRLLARGPRVRLTAEMVRDQALAVSGLLSDKKYGPSVKPPQPVFGLSAAFGRSMDWQPSPGPDRYRRGLYTEWRRTNPYPSMVTFDAPNRDVCAVRRARTNTPLQALVTLNDPVYVEAAQALARRVAAANGGTAEKAKRAILLCLSRPASDAEVSRLVALHAEAKAEFASEPKRAAELATNPLGPAPKGVDVADLAAWAVVANVLLNLDEMLMKR
jgi:mono/diheme cytochrome c family protein